MLQEKAIDLADYPDLTIIAGDMTNPDAIVPALAPNGKTVDIIVSAVGARPVIKGFSLSLEDPTICETSMRNILTALRTLPAAGNSTAPKPLLVAVSTTGINEPHARDVPYVLLPLYKVLLHVPHMDKKRMETLLCDEVEKPVGQRAIDRHLIVRPTLLTNGDELGMSRIRVGSDVEPAIGYTISRNDVGLFIYETAVKMSHDRRVESRIMSIAY